MGHSRAIEAALRWSAMTEHTPGIPLGSWLADLPDERLIRLLELRPDLAQPPPGSIAALAARGDRRAAGSARRHRAGGANQVARADRRSCARIRRARSPRRP